MDNYLRLLCTAKHSVGKTQNRISNRSFYSCIISVRTKTIDLALMVSISTENVQSATDVRTPVHLSHSQNSTMLTWTFIIDIILDIFDNEKSR